MFTASDSAEESETKKEIMNTELITMQPSITKGIEKYLAQDLLKFKFTCPEKYEITSEEMKKDAEKHIKIATSEKTRILAELKEVKQFLDNQKKPVLDYEKQVESMATSGKKFFEDALQVYLNKKAEEQRKLNDAIFKIQDFKNKSIQAVTNLESSVNLQISKLNALLQKWEIESANIPIEQTEEAIEILDTIDATIEAEVMPVEIVTQEKNFVQERLVEDKEEYSIGNEQAFIQWALDNKEYSLLEIKPKKSVFNSWVKLNGNKNHSFVRITVSKK